jgi:hypothetical protein
MKTSAIESGDTRIINPQCRFPAAAPYLQIQLHIMEVPAANDLARAFERATKARANALTMTADPTGLFVANQKQIVEFAAKKRLPAIYTSSTYVNAGGIKGTGYFFPVAIAGGCVIAPCHRLKESEASS